MSRGPARLRPSASQELLLRAVYAPPAEAQASWQALRADFDLDHLEEGSYALMPLLGRRLTEWEVDADLSARLRGIYRHNWYRGNVLLERLKELLAVVRATGLSVLLTGEPRLLLRSYRDAGLRATTRIDFVVRDEQREPFAAAIVSKGWTPAGRNARTVWLERRDGPAVSLQRADGVWRHAGSVELDGDAQPATSASDELLRLCTGEERRHPWHRLQWLADADALMRSEADEVDWERLVASARSGGETLRLREGLEALRAWTGAPVPEEAVARLMRVRPGARERLARVLGR